jgi:hypothetical protein
VPYSGQGPVGTRRVSSKRNQSQGGGNRAAIWLSVGDGRGVRATPGTAFCVDFRGSGERRVRHVDHAAAGSHLLALYDHHVRPGLESPERHIRLGLAVERPGGDAWHHEVGSNGQRASGHTGLPRRGLLGTCSTCTAFRQVVRGEDEPRVRPEVAQARWNRQLMGIGARTCRSKERTVCDVMTKGELG